MLPRAEHIVAATNGNITFGPGADDLLQFLVGNGLDGLIGIHLPETLTLLLHTGEVDAQFQTVAATFGEDSIFTFLELFTSHRPTVFP